MEGSEAERQIDGLRASIAPQLSPTINRITIVGPRVRAIKRTSALTVKPNNDEINRSAVASFQCPVAMHLERYTRTETLPCCPSLDGDNGGTRVRFEPQTFRLVSLRLNY
ncbi:hypothetical protein T265_03093 [Opisthorchis viverrini]|uniref:Uncharacterized protein n=1 Tax=Opisthorchis viverrini TaxID=6198 RepID=A0A074ZST1_OPIVI|nr:hypothetical protein T265_03093 [Opisthorchis viverrini]KER30483.1 hypothetical protein T265_03093 [Opisthorchis viverrini]